MRNIWQPRRVCGDTASFDNGQRLEHPTARRNDGGTMTRKHGGAIAAVTAMALMLGSYTDGAAAASQQARAGLASGCVPHPDDPCDPLPYDPCSNGIKGCVATAEQLVDPVVNSAPVEISSRVVHTIEAVASTSDGLYSPTDPEDGDPGGAGADAGVLTTGVASTAFFQDPTLSSLIELLAPSDPTATATGVLRFTTAAGEPVLCMAGIFAFTVPHTKKRAVAFGWVFCDLAVVITDEFVWTSTDTGLPVDASVGGSIKSGGDATFVDAATTTAGRRGHRRVTFYVTVSRDSRSTEGSYTALGGKGL